MATDHYILNASESYDIKLKYNADFLFTVFPVLMVGLGI